MYKKSLLTDNILLKQERNLLNKTAMAIISCALALSWFAALCLVVSARPAMPGSQQNIVPMSRSTSEQGQYATNQLSWPPRPRQLSTSQRVHFNQQLLSGTNEQRQPSTNSHSLPSQLATNQKFDLPWPWCLFFPQVDYNYCKPPTSEANEQKRPATNSHSQLATNQQWYPSYSNEEYPLGYEDVPWEYIPYFPGNEDWGGEAGKEGYLQNRPATNSHSLPSQQAWYYPNSNEKYSPGYYPGNEYIPGYHPWNGGNGEYTPWSEAGKEGYPPPPMEKLINMLAKMQNTEEMP